ncbi:MAG: hypothetical protein WCS69_00360 [Ignavibacteriaceae bacterium]|jgi:hypothetical protein
MEQNLISAELTAEQVTTINQSLAAAKELLPFLVTLTPEEKQVIPKLGNVLKPLVDKAAAAAVQYPQIFSGTFNREEFLKDYALLQKLEPVAAVLNPLHSAVEDTVMAVGSDTLVAALEVYSAVQANKGKVPGLDTLANEMKAFFPRGRKSIPLVNPVP